MSQGLLFGLIWWYQGKSDNKDGYDKARLIPGAESSSKVQHSRVNTDPVLDQEEGQVFKKRVLGKYKYNGYMASLVKNITNNGTIQRTRQLCFQPWYN